MLMRPVILGELLVSHNKITSSVVSKKNDISRLCYGEKFVKIIEYRHTECTDCIHIVYNH